MRERQAEKILEDEECAEIIRKRLAQDSLHGYRLLGYELIPLSSVSGFMGEYFKLRATVAGPADERRHVDFFAKVPPCPGSPLHDSNREIGGFTKEVLLYNHVFPAVFTQRDKLSMPRCFLGLEDALIVVEDMAPRGYGMPDKHVPFDLAHCEIVMRALARFHASSMIFEELQRRNLHEEFGAYMRETLWPLDRKRGVRLFDAAIKGLLSLVNLVKELSTEQRKKLREKIESLVVNHVDKLMPSKKYKNVICHGDLWANNILFKYDDNQEPVACCLIDFQLARYNPPANDILSFLQFSTTRDLRASRLDELLRVYHATLAASLSEASLDIEQVFPWGELVASVREARAMSMLHGLLNTPIMLLDEGAIGEYFVDEPSKVEEILFVDRTPLVCAQYEEMAGYRRRIADAVLELHEHLFAERA